MQITGMLHGARLLQFVGFPAAEALGPAASEDDIKALIASAAEIDDHLNRGRDMDTRTPAAQCRFVT